MKSPGLLSEMDRTILATLSEGPRSTPDLAQIVGSGAYRRCRRLEDLGLLQSTLEARPSLFCIECRTAVTRDNYQDHKDHEDQIRNTTSDVRRWSLTEKGQQEAKLETPP